MTDLYEVLRHEVERILVAPRGIPPHCEVPDCPLFARYWIPAWNAYRCDSHRDIHPCEVTA